jgi:hypothetical protein
MRSFSTENTEKRHQRKQKRRMIDITQDQIEDDDRMNKSAYVTPQITIKRQNEDKEEELSPLRKHRLT